MTHGIWASVGGMQVNEYRQSLAANNMANLNTVGFKNDLAVIRQRRSESGENPSQKMFETNPYSDLGGGSWVRPTYTSFTQGTLEQTGRSLDVALDGDGFFAVSDGSEVRYTRDGRFARNAAGDLVLSADGGRFRVLDQNGLPINIADPSIGSIKIGRNGEVNQGDEVLGRIGVVDFEDRTALKKAGQSTLKLVGDTQSIPATADIHGGNVEASTVDSIAALTSMIEVSRAYELNARMISLQDETLGMATTRIGRVG